MSALRRIKNIRKLARCGRLYFSTGRERIVTSGLPDIHIPDIAIHDLVLQRFTEWDNERFAIVSTHCLTLKHRYKYFL